MLWWLFVTLFVDVTSLELPGSCSSSQYYDPAVFSCQACLANSSLVKSSDGFSCSCDEHSVPSGPGYCRPCGPTEVVSSDGISCVPRKCQNVSGRVACRKCPNDYISVTQNLDGSPMKEVQCIKCARGFKPLGNICVRCESCSCTKAQVIVRGICIPKVYVNGRPTYTEKVLHPLELLDAVKHEYLCTKNDYRMCRTLANACVKNFYSSDVGGPCRLWLQPKLTPKGLPPLLVNDTAPGEMSLPREKGVVTFAVFVFTTSGGMFNLDNPENQKMPCQLPLTIRIGEDMTFDCSLNLSKLTTSEPNETLSPYVLDDGEYKPLSVSLIKPSGYHVQKGSWPSSWFSRYFLVHHAPSTASNATYTVYLRTMLIRLRLERDSRANGSLSLKIAIEAQYASSDQDSVTTTLKVEHVMPSAGVVRGLEIWGGTLGALLGLYALVHWRGVLRRGGPHYSLGPLLAGAAADTLYFAALITTVHSLAAEAGTLGMTLPLSRPEEKIIRDFLFSAVSLKVIKIAWINWRQCICDIFFISWAEYNPPVVNKASSIGENWKAVTLAREWSRLQTMRRACPGFTVASALFLLHFMSAWQSSLPRSQAYSWAIASIAWWCSYNLVLTTTWLVERFVASPASDLPKVCTKLGLSLIVFEEELYAHYVHGRNDDFQEVRSMAGPLATCRVACVPKLRPFSAGNVACRRVVGHVGGLYFTIVIPQGCLQAAVHYGPRKLSLMKNISPDNKIIFLRFRDFKPIILFLGFLGESKSRQALLSKFLAAFFERALDGLNWVASERTLLERALGMELTSRDAGSTSALLYDDDHTPSCFATTWWGEEWNLATFDAMVFSSAFIASGDALLAVLITLLMWQVLKQIRSWFGIRNQVLKTGVDVKFD